MCLSDEAGTRRCRNLISETEITAAGWLGMYTPQLEHTLDSLSNEYVTTRRTPLGEKKGRDETRERERAEQSRAWKAGAAECHKMPQKRVKYYMARVALIGQVRCREAL